MTWTWGSPPIIKHINTRKGDERDALCSQCGASLHLSAKELMLLSYYTQQKSGFKPAVSRIISETGLSRRTIFRVRQRLIDLGLIGLHKGRLLIDWQRIRLFASLEPEAISKHPFVAPVRPPDEQTFQPAVDDYFLSYAPLEELCAFFGSMTEQECRLWKQAYRKHLSRKMAL